MVVYKITNLVNGKLYIGITIHSLEKRFAYHLKGHKNGCPLLGKAIMKYGKENFTIAPIYFAKDTKELQEKEIFYIKHYNSLAPYGYNMLKGGYTNEMALEKHRKAIYRMDTNEIYESIVSASIKTGTPPYCIQFAVAGRQDFANDIPFRYVDVELFEKAEKRRKNRPARRVYPVLCLETKELYSSIAEARRKLKIHHRDIVKSCNTGLPTKKLLTFCYYKGEQNVKK